MTLATLDEVLRTAVEQGRGVVPSVQPLGQSTWARLVSVGARGHRGRSPETAVEEEPEAEPALT